MNHNIDFTRYKVFGWVVHQKHLASGARYIIELPEDLNSKTLGNITLFTKGRITGERRGGGAPVADRVAGVHNMDRDFIPSGVFDFVAQEDSEFWCFNHKVNKGSLPNVRPFFLRSGESTTLFMGTKLLLCAGEFSVGTCTFSTASAVDVVSDDLTVTANEDCHGFIFLE